MKGTEDTLAPSGKHQWWDRGQDKTRRKTTTRLHVNKPLKERAISQQGEKNTHVNAQLLMCSCTNSEPIICVTLD